MGLISSSGNNASWSENLSPSVRALTVTSVKFIHEHLTTSFLLSDDPISPPGIKDHRLLESAVYRQQAGTGDFLLYGDNFSNAATLMFGLCHNHAFHNGNKRTALMAGVMHLDINGYCLIGASNDQMYDLMLKITKHDVVEKPKLRRLKLQPDAEIRAVADWLRSKSRRTERGERQITFGDLYRILAKFGYKLGDRKDNKVDVLKWKNSFFGSGKWTRIIRIGCPGDSRSVAFDEIKRIREQLNLSENDGVDSASFYGDQLVLDAHIKEHRQVLRRLAKT